MANPEGSRPERQVNAIRCLGMRNNNHMFTLEDFFWVIDSYNDYPSEVRDELKRICTELAEDFEGHRAIGSFKLAGNVFTTSKFKTGHPHFYSLIQLLGEIREHTSMFTLYY